MLKVKDSTGKRMSFPDRWDEITYGQALDIAKLVESDLPKPFRQQLYSEKEHVEPTSDDMLRYLEFQVKYLAIISGEDADYLRAMRPKNGVGVSWLFERCSAFIGYPDPEACQCNEYIEIGGRRFYREESAVNALTGKEDLLKNVDYATFATGMMINSIINNLRAGDFRSDQLLILAATMFRPLDNQKRRALGSRSKKIEMYDYDRINERAVLFRKARASEVFGAYFFLQKEQARRLEHSKKLLEESLKKRLTNPALLLRFRILDLKWFFIGLWYRMPWLRKACSMYKARRRATAFLSQMRTMCLTSSEMKR